ncbi:MAG: hypothetical protein WAU68_04900 [Vitreimonas sp.]
MAETFMIHAGDVIEVQLTSETVVIESPDGRRQADDGARITNRMRLFVRHPDGKEEKYDFDDTELGVREAQTVAIVRGKLRRTKEPVNLILFNLSSGEHDPFERGLSAYLGHKPFFGPLAKAFVLSLGVAVIFFLVSDYIVRQGQGGLMSVFLALMFAFLTYPVFWGICGLWDRMTERMRYRRIRKQFIDEMAGRVRAHAPKPQMASAPAGPQQA